MQMLRNIYKLVFSIALGCATVGCSESLNLPDGPDTSLVAGAPGTITIRFKNAPASRNADSDQSETLIQSLTICLYDSPADDDAAPVYTRSFTPNEHTKTTVVMSLSDDLVEKLFTEENFYQCRMYAVANVDGLPAKPTVNQIKSHTVTSDFFNTAIQTKFAMSGEGIVNYTPAANPGEMGKAEGDGKLYRTAAKIQLNVKLPEKIEVEEPTADGGSVLVTWKPQTSNGAMRLLLNNGVQASPIVPVSGWEPTEESAYYNSNDSERQSYRTFTNGLGSGDYTYGTQVPFYTYTNAWEEAVEESHKTTLTLMVPWRRDGTDQYLSLYYQVPVTPGTLNQIVSNYSYIINLNVGMLGSPNPDTSVEVDDITYQVMDWATENIDVNINDTRYLVVNPNYYVANNESQIVIPFYTSHPVELNDIDITYQRYNFYSNGNGDVVDIDIDKDQIDKSVSGTDSICTYHIVQNKTTGQMSVVINHSLDMWMPVDDAGKEVELTDKADDVTVEDVMKDIVKYEKITPTQDAFSPYIIKINIRHIDLQAFDEKIEIVQYPAIYIKPDLNPGGTYVSGWTRQFQGQQAIYSPKLSEYGFVYVNPTYRSTSEQTMFPPVNTPFNYWENSTTLGGVFGLTSDNNKNPNMYVITISQLEQGMDYVIGNPCSSLINNNLNGVSDLDETEDNTVFTDCKTANVVYPTTSSTKRKLKYYYPTIESRATEKMLAPKIRIASSWGVSSDINRVNARRRCATYQEQGFPAGRWRLPTKAEFSYIIQLSSAKKIPVLFTPKMGYWTAQGAFQVNDKGEISDFDGDKAYVRAVYDEWYWENLEQYDMPKNQNGGYDYTLGDVPR